jgi:hypothetical protein
MRVPRQRTSQPRAPLTGIAPEETRQPEQRDALRREHVGIVRGETHGGFELAERVQRLERPQHADASELDEAAQGTERREMRHGIAVVRGDRGRGESEPVFERLALRGALQMLGGATESERIVRRRLARRQGPRRPRDCPDEQSQRGERARHASHTYARRVRMPVSLRETETPDSRPKRLAFGSRPY